MQIKEALNNLKWNPKGKEAYEALGLTEARTQEMVDKAGEKLTQLSKENNGVHGWEIMKVSIDQAETLEEALYMAFHAGHYVGISDNPLNKMMQMMGGDIEAN